jgi:enoyl-CoA hydratase
MGHEFVSVVDESDGVRVLVLNRPERMNSWNAQMRQEMHDAIDDTALDPGVRVLIVTGAGDRAFSAGEDVAEMGDLTAMGTRAFRAHARRIHNVFDAIEAMEIPVIAAIEGVAAGGGFELALSCDFRVAGETARFIMPEAKVGLIPGSGGCSRLVRHVGLGRAKELVMLGGTLRAPGAEQLGLVSGVSPAGGALDAAREMAGRLSAVAPLALGMAKLVLNTCTDVDAETGRRLERLAQSVLKTTEDHTEGAQAFLSKRTPRWQAC